VRGEQTLNPGLLLVDRDGTLIIEREYLSDPAGVELLPGASEGLLRFRQAGFRLVVVTNQAGIGRGYYTVADMEAVNHRMVELFGEQGVDFDAILHCPHAPKDNCDCRKPNTAMAEEALARFPAPDRLVMIGDKALDVEMGRRVGAITVLVTTGYGRAEIAAGATADHVANSLLDAAGQLGF
jgi:D-glycero-D-manno-heptose 1,7-bisphosphate phosphatase